MQISIKPFAVLAAFCLLGSPVLAQQTVELVTGIGFGNSQPEAMQNAVRAWILEGTRLYGSADFNTALTTGVDCNQQAQAGTGATTMGIGVEGDATGSWSCSVSGLPLSAIQG